MRAENTNKRFITSEQLLILSLFLSLFLGFNFATSAQSPVPPGAKGCGTDIQLRKLRQDKKFEIQEEEVNKLIRNLRSNLSPNKFRPPVVMQRDGASTTLQGAANGQQRLASPLPPDYDYVLPVVVHIIHSNPNSITDQIIYDAIADLNDAFAHTGNYAGRGTGVNTRIRFCLVKKAPDGGVTDGINRITSDYENFDNDMEDAKLKAKMLWDPSRYINIWYVQQINSELDAEMSCGVWTRTAIGGYATLPFSHGGATDGIVVSGFGALLAHEMGHYLGLYHTFEGENCRNGDCTRDGDQVCDTPPDRLTSNSAACDRPDNSCNTDTLSAYSNGFFRSDVPDMISNFMDYGNDNCHSDFTQGQAIRMLGFIPTLRGSLLLQNQCDQPCISSVRARFTRDDWHPKIGTTINFTNQSVDATNYEWTVDGVVVGNTPDISYTFSSRGNFKVRLKAWSADPACFSTYTDFVLVDCGVDARFYPDKRLIAAKDDLYIDSIYFTNRSFGANSFRWIMSNDAGMNEQVVSSSKDLLYFFRQPGNYTLKLEAGGSGGCIDTSSFHFTVLDATMDAWAFMNSIDCYKNDSILIDVSICNNGYDTLNKGLPISFYDADPRIGPANLLGTFYTDADIPGRSYTGGCCGSMRVKVKASSNKLDKIMLVLNDNGSTSPWTHPNSGIPELRYTNNFNFRSGFQFRARVDPSAVTVGIGTDLPLFGSTRNGRNLQSINWTPTDGLSCVNCLDPVLHATKNVREKLYVVSEFFCEDSAFSDITVVPVDDFTIAITNSDCASNDSIRVQFEICNQRTVGKIPSGLAVSFYSADPRVDNSAKILGPQYLTNTVSSGNCGTYIHTIKNSSSGHFYAVVNNQIQMIPLVLPDNEVHKETTYSNNFATGQVRKFSIKIAPSDTTVLIQQPVNYQLVSTDGSINTVSWTPQNMLSCSSCMSPDLRASMDTLITAQAVSTYGCNAFDTARIKLVAPDFTVNVLDQYCFRNDSIRIRFSVCNGNNYTTLPDGLPVSFYDADPRGGAARLLSTIRLSQTALQDNCAEFVHIVKNNSTGRFFIVVNDAGLIMPVNLPNTPFRETNFGNNFATATYSGFSLRVSPIDTTVLRKSIVPLKFTEASEPVVNTRWSSSQSISCPQCALAEIRPLDSVTVRGEMLSTYGCLVITKSAIKIFPPDFFTSLTDIKCYKNDSIRVTIKVCTGNNYDQLPDKLSVRFYDGQPIAGSKMELLPSYKVNRSTLPCEEIILIVAKPVSGKLFVTVNDKGSMGAVVPEKEFEETSYNNNVSSQVVTAFKSSVSPIEVSGMRGVPVELTGIVSGENARSVLWQPSIGFSCTTCLKTQLTPQYSSKVQFVATSEYGCVDTSYLTVKIHTGGKVNIPNGFTPNRDGVNDVFYIMGGKEVKAIKSFIIFNRWGEKVFESRCNAPNDPLCGWNGTLNGKEASAGTYVYMAVIEFVTGVSEGFKGTITLIR